jgi:hypothetical protein
LRDLVISVLNSESSEVAAMIVDVADTAYVEVDSKDVATNRISASATSAAWSLYDWVTHEKLALQATEEAPVRYFSYGKDVSEIVNRMLEHCLAECRGLALLVDHADTRVAHMQASIGRMANLMGAEYVTQTRQVMDWIAASPDEGTSQLRKSTAAQQFETRVLPQVFDWARVNFIRIEQNAFSKIEELNEKWKTDGASADGAARPASN